MKTISHSIRKTPKAPFLIKLTMLLTVFLISTVTLISLAHADSTYRVKPSDNLNDIVSRHYIGSRLTRAQLMVGVLAKNPRAFKGGNINFLMRGRRLVLPAEENMPQVSDEQARALLSKHARYYRRGVTGNLALPDFAQTDEEFQQLNKKHQEQREKLKQLEQEREALRERLDRLTQDKQQSDQKLEALEVRLKQGADPASADENRSAMAAAGDNSSQKTLAAQSLHEEVISEENRRRELEQQVKERTRKLQENNQSLQKKLHETHSELAENRRENIVLERQLAQIKTMVGDGQPNGAIGSANRQDAPEKPGDSPDSKNTGIDESTAIKETASQSAAAMAKAPSSQRDNAASGSLFGGKLILLVPLLVILAGVWFLLRHFKSKRKSGKTHMSQDPVITENWPSTDTLDSEFEEVSLETSIKLDVAQAYLEVGNSDAARDMLNEVIEEGTESQKQKAGQLLQAI